VFSQEKKIPALKTAVKATLLSTALPGLGQVYNKKYWKVPIIYAAGGALSYFAISNHKEYKDLRDAINNRQSNNNLTSSNDAFPQLSTDQLRTRKDHFRRQRDYNIIFIGLLYVANIIDANVDAHLREFDVNDDLSMNLSPIVIPTNSFNNLSFGLSLTLRLKK